MRSLALTHARMTFRVGLAALEGLLYRVTVCHTALIGPVELRTVDGEFRLN